MPGVVARSGQTGGSAGSAGHMGGLPVGVTSGGVAETLASLIGPQLKAVDALFARELTSDLPNVNELVQHVGKFRGKMLRPMLVLLSGLSAGGIALEVSHSVGAEAALNTNHITLATVVEMVHMATL